jgi:predicted O-methyltransferase YrrM
MNYNFSEIWSKCLNYNIEQKPEEFEKLLDLLDSKKSKKYALEIGSNFGGTAYALCHLFENVITLDIKHHENFDRIKSEFNNYNYIIGDSTSIDIIKLFENMNIKFDFIFIDGDHTYDGVKSDYENFKRFLSNEGIIGFHDIIESEINKTFSNQVDILWRELSFGEKVEFISNQREYLYKYDSLFHQLNTNTDYSSFGGIGVFRNYPISVFVHNYLDNNWFEIVQSQFEKLKNSELYMRADKIFYGVYSKSINDLNLFINMIKKLDTYQKIEIQIYKENNFEFSTLMHLQNHCRNNKNGSTLYFHTKGTSREYSSEISSWRECLEYFNIENWKSCVYKIKNENYDISGALYVTWFEFLNYRFENYYSGNFWWSSNEYISRLPEISNLTSMRTNAELWLGMSPHRWFSFYSKSLNSWYDHYFDPMDYKK